MHFTCRAARYSVAQNQNSYSISVKMLKYERDFMIGRSNNDQLLNASECLNKLGHQQRRDEGLTSARRGQASVECDPQWC